MSAVNEMNATSAVPSALYKYRSMSGVDGGFTRRIMEHHELFWSTPLSFNDPFDCMPIVHFKASRLKRETATRRIIREFGEMVPRDQRKAALARAMSWNDAELEQLFNTQHNQMLAELSVCCLSENFDHVLMWSHYAQNHSGVCLRFRVTMEDPAFVCAMRVKYSPDRPIFSFFEREDKTEIMNKAILTKADFWAYEQEWRMVDMQGGAKVKKFNGTVLDGVFLGSRIADADRQWVMEWADKRLYPVEVHQISLAHDRFRLASKRLR